MDHHGVTPRRANSATRQSKIQAHTLVYSFDDLTVQTKVDSGLTILASVTGTAQEKLAESAFRGWGLLIST